LRWDNLTGKCLSRSITLRINVQERPALSARANLALRSLLLGLAMACSLWDSLQGSRVNITVPYEPAPNFPHRAGHQATGRLHCSFSNFSRVSKILLAVKPGCFALAGACRNFLTLPEVVCFVKLSGFFRSRFARLLYSSRSFLFPQTAPFLARPPGCQLLDFTRSCLFLQT